MNCLLLAHLLVLAVIIPMTSSAVVKSYKFLLWPVWYPQGLFFSFFVFFLYLFPLPPFGSIEPMIFISHYHYLGCLIYIKVFECFINLFRRLASNFCGFSLNKLLSCYCHVNMVIVSIIFFPIKMLDVHLFICLSENIILKFIFNLKMSKERI